MSRNIPSLISWELLSINTKNSQFIKTAAKKEEKESEYDDKGNKKSVTDREGKEFNPRKGMEGPFLNRDNKAYYYDNKEGKYYCPYMDMFLDEKPELKNSKSASSNMIFKVSCGNDKNAVDGVFFSRNKKEAFIEFFKMAKSAGIDLGKVPHSIQHVSVNLLDVLKTAKYRHGKMSLNEAAEKVIDSTMTGTLDSIPSQDPEISQLISQLDVLVDTMSSVVGEDLSIQDVLDAFNDAAQSKGASIERQDADNEASEMYLKFPKDKLLPPATPKEASSNGMSKEAKKSKSKSSSKRKPTKPELWSRAKAEAKKKFDVYPCVPLESMALTKKGWKNYNEIKIGDEILTYNIPNGYTEWQSIDHIHFYQNAETLRIKTPGTNFNFICTPSHKWVLKKNWNLEKTSNKGCRYWHKDCLIKSEDLNSHLKILTSAKIKDSESNLVLENFSKYNDDWVENIIKMNNDQRASFLASAIIYDGHEKLLQEKFKDRYVNYGFSQKNKNHGDAFEICATLLGYRVSFRQKSYNQDMRDWTISKRNYQSTQNVEKEIYKTMDVWCPTTKNNTWVMKQDGMISITGNSAYANLWASKWYKEKGGGWRKS